VATSLYFPDDFEEFRVIFLQDRQRMANALNVREISIYDLTENLTGEQWSIAGNPQQKRQTYRIIVFIGAIAAGATLTTAHGLTGVVSYTDIYGTVVTDAPDNRPIPFASTVNINQQISILVDATNIIITVGAGSPNVVSGNVILEYLKN